MLQYFVSQNCVDIVQLVITDVDSSVHILVTIKLFQKLYCHAYSITVYYSILQYIAVCCIVAHVT